MEQVFFIKGMVCSRCIASIKNGAKALNLPLQQINLGKVILSSKVTPDQQTKFINYLVSNGFNIISDRNTRIVEQIKQLSTEYLNDSETNRIPFSRRLLEKLLMNYDSISDIFFRHEKTTIERYLINQRIERVIELIMYSSYSLTEISRNLGYSSINHLSKQFKQITGFTPSHYRRIKKDKSSLSVTKN